MSEVLLIQNTRIEGSGHLGNLLSNDGFDITSVHAKHEEIPKKKFSFVVILGAPESANDDLPYLIEEQKLIKNCVENSSDFDNSSTSINSSGRSTSSIIILPTFLSLS